ncbi:RHS repeat-associated core domain-containing protein [Shewanella chilikensis]|uniref:RHS repeat domain-containing protein n=1 Tax=Shewanella chilikensis TaxID=558541 RepID=UPI00399AE6CB
MVMNNSHFEYDGAGQLLKGRNAVSELAFSYDALGRLIAETQNGQSIEYQYTAAGRPIRANGLLLEQLQTWQHGRLATIAASGFEPLTLAYDRYGRETSRSNQAGFCLRQEYTPEGLLKRQHLDAWSPQGTEQQLPGRFGGIARSYEYDALSRITAIEDGHWGRSEFTQNALGQIVAEKRTSAWHTRSERRQFSYDSELQLTAIASWAEDGQNKDQLSNSSPNSTSNSRIIDFAKKRQEKALEYQQAGRVVRQGDNVFRYDANGRMVEKTLKRDGFRAQTSFYHWDEEDRLIRVSLPNGDIWHYEYDVFGRRCRKYRQQPATQPTSAQSLTQQISQGDIRYQWLGDQLSQQQSYYADGSVATTQWLYEPGSFRPLAQIRQLDTPNDPGRPELHYAVTDLVGNVRELCDPQGQIHWRGEQGLWQDFHQWRLSGTPKKYLEQAANEPLHCDLRYQGQIYDRETGLYYNRHRYYDPEICQYLSPDPIGLAGGTRPQAYVHNPLEWVDPLGLMPLQNPVNQGHHMVPHSVASHMGISPFNSQTGVPAMYWSNSQWSGIEHSAMHGYNGIGTQTKPLVKSAAVDKANLTPEEWMATLKAHYENPELSKITGDLHLVDASGNKGELIAKNVTPAEAWKETVKWGENNKCPKK